MTALKLDDLCAVILHMLFQWLLHLDDGKRGLLSLAATSKYMNAIAQPYLFRRLNVKRAIEVHLSSLQTNPLAMSTVRFVYDLALFIHRSLLIYFPER